ncbi:MAG TPA: hypothetical protein ENG95_04425, partial [Nitrospirae bacterium]|nr:hypothetical protein [Nitrospirota bacterium]
MRVIQSKTRTVLVILSAAVLLSVSWGIADAGVYLDSAHGDGTYGVNRSGASGFPTDYPEGFCAHCHEQHASIGGSEPAPTIGTSPSKLSLFYYPPSPSQTDNFCFQCHTGSGSYQYGSNIVNRSYSYRAG